MHLGFWAGVFCAKAQSSRQKRQAGNECKNQQACNGAPSFHGVIPFSGNTSATKCLPVLNKSVGSNFRIAGILCTSDQRTDVQPLRTWPSICGRRDSSIVASTAKITLHTVTAPTLYRNLRLRQAKGFIAAVKLKKVSYLNQYTSGE
ncbi:MAG: hypothetical protein WBC92_16065 [Terracidiphilus sp.]